MKNRLDYNDGKHVLPQGAFRAGASGLSRYFTSTSSWYRENLCGEEGFIGSDSSILGTIVHGILEGYITGDPLPAEEIQRYLQKQKSIVSDLDIDYINNQYPLMADVAMQYLSTVSLKDAIAEKFVSKEMLPGIFIGGSIDLTLPDKGVVVDYKTTSAKYPPKSIAYSWKLQLLTYARLLRDEGYNIQYIRVVSISTYIDGGVSEKTGKPLKSYPPTVTVLEEPITPEDMEMMDNIFELISKSVQTYIQNPHLRPLLAQDMRVAGLPCTVTLPEDEEI